MCFVIFFVDDYYSIVEFLMVYSYVYAVDIHLEVPPDLNIVEKSCRFEKSNLLFRVVVRFAGVRVYGQFARGLVLLAPPVVARHGRLARILITAVTQHPQNLVSTSFNVNIPL